MKKIIIKAMFVLLILTGFINNSSAQRIYVSVRPAAPVYARPACPRPGMVWITGDWIWQPRRGYVWKEGYWAAPPGHRSAWVGGHWVRDRRGSYWVRGCWR